MTNITNKITPKEQEYYREAMNRMHNRMHQEFRRMVERYQQEYNLPIHISLDASYREGREVQRTNDNPFGFQETFQMWSTKNYTMERTE